MASSRYTWAEQLYRYAEHLFWTPQQIGRQSLKDKTKAKTFEEVGQQIRQHEESLNFLFNIILGLLPLRIKSQLLNAFAKIEPSNRIQHINIYKRLTNIAFIQPDVVLEADQANICIELKVKPSTHLSLEQLYKYIFLLARWQNQEQSKSVPFLFFLTKNDLRLQWKPKERKHLFTGEEYLTCLVDYLKINQLPESLAGVNLIYLHDDAKDIINNINLGWANWQIIGNIFKQEIDLLKQDSLTEGEEVLFRLLADFLDELESRKLWYD